MTNHVLITGGAGFIGSRLVRALLQKNPALRIWVLDNLHPQVHGADAAPPDFPEGVTFIRGDVANAKTVFEAVEQARPELVYHLAAETGTGQSYDEPTRYCSVNVIGTTNLVEALRKTGTAHRVVLAASRAIYGEGAYRDAEGRECLGLPRSAEAMNKGDFSVPLPPGYKSPGVPSASHAGLSVAPASIYASTKLMQEYILTQTGEGADWDVAILRFQNVYGPGQSLRNPYTGVLSIFSKQLLSGADLSIYEDGEIARDFIFVDDVVNALVCAGERPIRHGTVLDIGSGRAETILNVAQTLMRELGRGEKAYRISGAFRIGDIRHACADIRAAQSLLGWAPQVTLEHGLAQLAVWAREEYRLGKL